jgi:hypothetical protein
MSTVKGHSVATPRHSPAGGYATLCQCGWAYSGILRVLVDEQRAQHRWRAPQPIRPGWRCPCGVWFNTRRDRESHMLECGEAPAGWTA